MIEEDKRPVVYVPRELYAYDTDGECIKFGYFVSTAHLQRKVVDYKKNGENYNNYFVSLDHYISNMDNKINIYTENGDYCKDVIFKDYRSCKAYVDELNKWQLIILKQDRIYSLDIIERKFKEVMEYGKMLEEKYIPAEAFKEI